MRHIIFISVLLGLPFAAAAQDEAQGTQTQSGQDQQQTQDEAATQAQPASTTEDSFGEQSQTVSAESGEGEAEAERAQFTSNVQDREPVDEVSEYEVSGEPLYFFTEIKNGAGQTITHRWLRDGEVEAEVPLEVGSDSWRTWSSKELSPELEGEWTVEVVDAQGNTITEESITVESSGAQTENVGYSPEEQDQTGQMEETTTQGETATTEETSATEDTDMPPPEQIEYEQESETQAQDPMQEEDDMQQDDSTGEDY